MIPQNKFVKSRKMRGPNARSALQTVETQRHATAIANTFLEKGDRQMSNAVMRAAEAERLPRWATRQEAMSYARCGSTRMNEWLRSGKLEAKKDGSKIIVNLNSIDDMFEALPSAAAGE
jgi:hypothetical protein